MQNISRLAICASLMAVLTSCVGTVNTPDGKLPNQLVAEFQKHVGAYQGNLDLFGYNANATLSLSLDGNTPKLAIVNDRGSDVLGQILHKNCDAHIGQINSVYVEKNGVMSIKGVSFQVDANLCDRDIEGNTYELSFSDDAQKLHISLLQRQSSYDSCTRDADTRSNECTTMDTSNYFTGTFRK